MPPSPWIGSMMTAAIESFMTSAIAGRLSKGTCWAPPSIGMNGSRYFASDVADSAPKVRAWELVAVVSLASCCDPCARSFEGSHQRMLAAAVEQADRLDAATDRLSGGQQLDACASLAVLGDLHDLVEMDQRDHAPLIADVAHEPWRVGKDQQTLGLERGRDLHRQPVAVDIDRNAVVADRGRGDYRQVAVLQQQSQELRLDSFDAATMVTVQELDLVALFDAQIGLAPSDRDAAVHRRKADRARAQRPESLHDALVLLAGVGHQEMIHRDRV